jgi:hypothetical protein
MFAEGLVTGRVGRTSEPIMAFMCQLMSSESCGCKKTLCASFPITVIRSFACVGAFNVLLQMLFFNIRFIATFKATHTWSFICVRSKMGCESCRPVECLDASFDSAFDCFQLRGELLSTWGEGGDGCLCASYIILRERIVIIYFVILKLQRILYSTLGSSSITRMKEAMYLGMKHYSRSAIVFQAPLAVLPLSGPSKHWPLRGTRQLLPSVTRH